MWYSSIYLAHGQQYISIFLHCHFPVPYLGVNGHILYSSLVLLAACASYQIRKIAGCACVGYVGNVFPPPRVSDPDMIDDTCVKPRSHCADHSLPMFPIIADCPDLSWSWQNHQIVALTPDLCLSKTASTILARQLYDTGTTEVFGPLWVRFPRPSVRPLIRSTRLYSRC